MSLLGTIVSKILHPFGGGEAKADTPATETAGTGGAAGAPSGTGTIPTAEGGKVDVEAVLNDMASKAGQPLNWRTSIVDLMKLLASTAACRPARSWRRSCTTAAIPTTRRR